MYDGTPTLMTLKGNDAQDIFGKPYAKSQLETYRNNLKFQGDIGKQA
jgi:hypothetical protein